MFDKVTESDFVRGEHDVLQFWEDHRIFQRLREQNAEGDWWNFLDGPITANNPMGVHHAWGRTYKDAYQRYFAMTGHQLRYQNGFDCQGLWVEVEVEKELGCGTKNDVMQLGIDRFVTACKQRVLKFAARQTEQSIRLGYWMDWDDPDQLRRLADALETEEPLAITTPTGRQETGRAEELVARLGNPEWGGSYFTFSTENNETIWSFLKKCFARGKIYRGHDVMPWSGRGGSAYSQMEIADGRKLTVHRSVFVRFPIRRKSEATAVVSGATGSSSGATGSLSASANTEATVPNTGGQAASATPNGDQEYLLVWTTTPWTLTSNVACAVNPDLDYVRLQATRDGAIYYFAADNLEFHRLEKEFREGFGRPEWAWPKDVPRLKTIAQMFKEQGGYEVLGTLKGAELVGWEYDGPFDNLAAQNEPGGVPQDDELTDLTGITCHRVIDGGRDSRGTPHVVAGEGTGIVHIAPGCGDVDHHLGAALGLVGIAPLGEDGRFIDGFGEFTGRKAIDPDTADLVFDTLREKQLLVAVEQYPHIYPHCWRTGDELVFRLVDEWFINMDWREEIKDVTRTIRWLPESVNGQERELEWLTNMRDWMISKKRFWGLALPIWVDEQTGDFEVIGSLTELKERAVEGWDEFEGHTPHRPWIDQVKIRNPQTGHLMARISDVGNPWLDAGIVPFSTMSYNTDHETWRKWYPADFVTECFPGQFRNWFYSLLATATMMLHEEPSPKEKRPFKTLLGHRLVMNQDGQPMHKSDGTAIWFEEAAEQLGVDTMRWMYLAQDPATDLRFGTRHPDRPVTIQTPDGPVNQTAEGVSICEVVSKPADEIRRQILIPLWNSYAFFVNYARLDEFDPAATQVPLADRPEIDRWILSNLQALIETAHHEFENFNVAEFCRSAAAFIDDLSNWYIRRNRRRFWRSKPGRREMQQLLDETIEKMGSAAEKRGLKTNIDGPFAGDTDKLAAYQTLYEVLVTLIKLLAPCIPFLAERMYQNLAHGNSECGMRNAEESIRTESTTSEFRIPNSELPPSIHLCKYPNADASRLDPELNRFMAVAQQVVKLGHKLREEASLRVRQPLAELRYHCDEDWKETAISGLESVILDELNVKQMVCRENLDDLVHYSYKPNLKTLGPKYGKLLGAIRGQLPELSPDLLAPLRSGESVTVEFNGQEVVLMPDDVLISTEQAADWACTDDHGIQIALRTTLTPELKREGIARDFVRHVQQLRKDAGLEIEDRIVVHWSPADDKTDDDEVRLALRKWETYIQGEVLADELVETAPDETTLSSRQAPVGGIAITVGIRKAGA